MKNTSLKKGTTFYRTTPNKDEKNSNGPIYVTYIKKDRDIYRGAYSEWILETQGLNRKHPLYERKFKNTEDLIAPSRKELDDLILDISKKKNDKSLKLLAGAAKIDATLRMRNIKKILISFYYDPDNPKESMKKAEEAIEKNKGLRIKDYIDTKGSNSLRDYLTDVKSSFGESKESKEIIINELKKRGYNSIVDYAGVGSTKYGIEGVSPMIVFDDKILNDLGTKKLGFLSRRELTFNPIEGLNINYKGNKWLKKASASAIRKNSKKIKDW